MYSISGDDSQPMGFPNILNQQGAGTRRTVYYNNESKTDVAETSAPDESAPNPPYVVCNIVKTVVGGEGTGNRPAPPSPNNSVRSHRSQQTMPKLSPTDDTKRKARKENSIWFEYGCI